MYVESVEDVFDSHKIWIKLLFPGRPKAQYVDYFVFGNRKKKKKSQSQIITPQNTF